MRICSLSLSLSLSFYYHLFLSSHQICQPTNPMQLLTSSLTFSRVSCDQQGCCLMAKAWRWNDYSKFGVASPAWCTPGIVHRALCILHYLAHFIFCVALTPSLPYLRFTLPELLFTLPFTFTFTLALTWTWTWTFTLVGSLLVLLCWL